LAFEHDFQAGNRSLTSRIALRLNIVLVLALLLLGTLPASAASSETDATEQTPSAGWIVQMSPGWSQFQSRDGFARTFGDARLEQLGSIPDTFVAHFEGRSSEANAIARIASQPGVAFIEPNYIYQYQEGFIPNDPGFPQQEWAKTVDLPRAWAISGGRDDLVVAVLDSGISPNHSELQGKLIPGYNFKDDNADTTDTVGHGTAVAGIIGATANNETGIAGTAMNVRLMPVKVGAENGAEVVHIASGIHYAVDNGADVINISLGADQPSVTLHNAIKYAYENNVVVVAAAGNKADSISYPGSFLETISVGATTVDGQHMTSFSSRIGVIDLVAPGADVISTYWHPASGNTYALVSGTSYAAPIVTGTVALMRSIQPGMPIEDVRTVLKETARTDTFVSDSTGSGAGLLDAYSALERVMIEPYAATWLPADEPVAGFATQRSWLWGPDAFDIRIEPYAQAEHGFRLVAYFDKSRMEITNVYGDRNDPWFVTNGLLVNELISGNMQVGEQQFEWRGPAEIPVAGDPTDLDGPLYASFRELLDEPAPEAGALLTATLARDGTVGDDARLADYGVQASFFVPETGFRIADVFWDYLNSTGTLRRDGQYIDGQIFDPTFFAVGLPVTNAYWSRASVAGQPQDVLIQCFERRCLTYTPSNAPEWQVEMGNVGQHYFRWRYQTEPAGPYIPNPAHYAVEFLR
jgi:thermitase